MGKYVLWTAPQEEWNDGEGRPFRAHLLERLGAVAFPESMWRQLTSSVEELPRAERFPPANGRALADAWVLGPGRPHRLSDLDSFLRERLIGGDTLDKSELIELVGVNLDRLLSSAGEIPDYTIVEASESGARMETLYFDGPMEEDWPALAFLGGTVAPALDRDHVLLRREQRG